MFRIPCLGLTVPSNEKELNRFYEFPGEQLSRSGADLNLDELFELWRAEHAADGLYAEHRAAFNTATGEFKGGDREAPAGEHCNMVRRQFGGENERYLGS